MSAFTVTAHGTSCCLNWRVECDKSYEYIVKLINIDKI